MFSSQDHQFMSQAIALAKRGQYTTSPNPNVGCVIVKDGVVVGEGYHVQAGEPHAEIHALQAAGKKALGAVAYVTLEPCSHQGRTPPCALALVKAGVSKVIAAMQDPNPLVSGNGLALLEKAGIATRHGLLSAEAGALNAGFVQRMTKQKPFVRVKMAASLDGRTAMASGESQWITGAAARADVHRLRATSSAVMTGIGTILDDNPSLTVRTKPADYEHEVRQPIRVVCDSQLRIPESANLFKQPGETWVMTCSSDRSKIAVLEKLGAKVYQFEAKDGRLPLPSVLTRLAELEVNDLMVEAGATLSGQIVQQGLADELWLYLAPQFLGSDARGLFNMPGLDVMADKINLNVKQVRCVGQDLRIIAELV
jgi:diaminohydroxyphosphoribosylaminopyrimidine deaminase / 5-amino-6-(5-phosphoribosylamino)uracil reductase